MKKIIFIVLLLTPVLSICAQDIQKSIAESKKIVSNFHLGVDLQTKYIWRGMEMMSEDSTPVIFPSISYADKGINAYVMGGYSFNGKYAEVDLGVSYTWKWLSLSINGYYYPSTNTSEDNYFDFRSQSTGHWWEGVVTIAPEKYPVCLTLSNFFAGADKKIDGRQAYSTYAEVKTYYDFFDNNTISLAIGATFNESCYNNYEHDFSVCNIELKYTHNLQLKNDFTLPLSVAYIINPVNEKSFVNFMMSFSY